MLVSKKNKRRKDRTDNDKLARQRNKMRRGPWRASNIANIARILSARTITEFSFGILARVIQLVLSPRHNL